MKMKSTAAEGKIGGRLAKLEGKLRRDETRVAKAEAKLAKRREKLAAAQEAYDCALAEAERESSAPTENGDGKDD